MMSDEDIAIRVSELMNKLDENQKLQELTKANGLDIKNSVELTDDTKENVAVGVISLLLAKSNDDERYKTLVQSGLQKRSLKTEIINSYKNQANQLLAKYRNK